jgi:uncharacterized repeat protein (TIGR04138 family)
MTAAEKFKRLLSKDARFDPEAYNFVYEALDYTLKHIVKAKRRENHHVAGPELLEGIRRLCIDQFGCLARTVLEIWGVSTTDDFGEIIFNLVDYDLMGKQESDRREDFQRIYFFSEVFDLLPVFSYNREKDEWQTSYVQRSALTRAAKR